MPKDKDEEVIRLYNMKGFIRQLKPRARFWGVLSRELTGSNLHLEKLLEFMYGEWLKKEKTVFLIKIMVVNLGVEISWHIKDIVKR